MPIVEKPIESFDPVKGGTMYHGTSGGLSAVKGNKSLYLTADPREAGAFAANVHRLGEQPGEGARIIKYEMKPGKTLNVDDQILSMLQDGEYEEQEIQDAARKAGARYITHEHPSSFEDGKDFQTVVSLYPEEDVTEAGNNGTKTLYRGTQLPGGKSSFASTFYAEDPKVAAQYGDVKAHEIDFSKHNILNIDDPKAKSLLEEYTGEKLEDPEDFEDTATREFMFPDKPWTDFLKSKGYTGTQIGKEYALINDVEKEAPKREPIGPKNIMQMEPTDIGVMRPDGSTVLSSRWDENQPTPKEHADLLDNRDELLDVLKNGGVRFGQFYDEEGSSSEGGYVNIDVMTPKSVRNALKVIDQLPVEQVQFEAVDPEDPFGNAFSVQGTPKEVRGKILREMDRRGLEVAGPESKPETKSDLIGPRPTSEDAETLRSWANNGYSESARMAENIAEEIEYPEDEQDKVGGEITPLVNKDREGRITTAASLRDNPVSGDLYISYLATNPELLGRGYGTQMLGRIAQIAADRGAGLSLEATPDSLPFWEKMGAKETPEGFLGWDDKQVKKLAEDLQHPKAPVDIDKLHYPAQDFQAKTGEPIKINAYRATMSPDVADIKNVERGSFFAPEAMGDFGDHIYRAVLDFKNPLVADDGTAAAKALGDEKLARQFEDLLSGWDSEKDEPLHMDEHTWEDADKKLTAAAKAAGHDGVIFHGHDDMNPVQYIAVDPNTITNADKVGKYNWKSMKVEPDEAEEPNEKGTSKLADAAKLYSQGLIDGHKIASVSRAVINGDDVNEAGINAGATDEHIAAAKMLVKAVDDAKPKDVEMYRAVTPSERYGQDLLKVKSGDTVNLDRISSFSTDRSQAAYYGEKGKPNVELKIVGENRTVPTDEMTGMGHQEHLTYGKFRVVDVEGPSSIDLPEAFKGNTKYKRTVILEPADGKAKVGTGEEFDRDALDRSYGKIYDQIEKLDEQNKQNTPEHQALVHMHGAVGSAMSYNPEIRNSGRQSIVMKDGEVTGAAEMLLNRERDTATITSVGSTERGAGSMAMKHLLEQIKEIPSVKKVELSASPFSKGMKFYEKFGFKDVGEPDEFGNQQMELKLSPDETEPPKDRTEGPDYSDKEKEILSHFDSHYKPVGEKVNGRTVREHVPDWGSINATLGVRPGAYDVLDGIREVKMSEFPDQGAVNPRIKDLAAEIKNSKELNPLIVGIDSRGPYIIEGSHRFDALRLLKAKSFPAAVAIDLTDEKLPDSIESSKIQRLTEKINNRDWWHVPPVEGDAAYAKRGKFLAPTYRDAEFYGRPLNDAQKVNITNPIVGPEKEIAKKLGLDPQREGMSQKELNAHDRAWALAAKKAGYDAIVTVGEKQWKKFKETGRIPADMEVNDLKELKE